MPVEIERGDVLFSPGLTLTARNVRPHWKKYGSGGATLKAFVDGIVGVGLIAEEWAEGGASKRTWFHLDAAAATALRDYLNERLQDIEARRVKEVRQDG